MSQQSNVSTDSGGYVFVTSTKKQRKNKQFAKRFVKPNTQESEPIEKSVLDIGKFLRSFEETQLDLKSSNYFNQAIEKVRSVLSVVKLERIICLGLGKFLECPISRHQLAFICCLQKELKCASQIQYFDPIFGSQEVEVLNQLNGKVLLENCEGKYEADVVTLFYLPHCPKQISNNLLWKNWNLKSLEKVFLIGNSFASIIRNNPRKALEQNANFILKLKESCREFEFENNFKHKDIFNDTSLHFFDTTSLQNKTDAFCVFDEPHYAEEDLELVTKNIQACLAISENDNGNC